MSERNDWRRPPDQPTRVERPSSERSRPSDATAVVGDPGQVTSSGVATETAIPGVELGDVIGVGGMGIVMKARQRDLDRQVAFKKIIDDASDDMRARFVREARLTAQLDHPNIVPVHLMTSIDTVSSTGYAMKLVEGKTLAKLLREAAELAEKRAIDDEHALSTRLEHFLKICDAIAFAHERQIMHRDLKPSNVMVGAFGEVYVMDWGIARLFGEAEPETTMAAPRATPRPDATPATATLTRVGAVVGSLQYMSPEQASGRTAELDGRTDQYALGLLLQEIVSLEPAMEEGPDEVVHMHAMRGRRAPFECVDGRRTRVPRELQAIVKRATSYERNDRYPSVRALADDVRRFMRNESVMALPEGLVARAMRFVVRHRRATFVALLLFVAATACVLVWSRYKHVSEALAVRERGGHLTSLYSDVARQGHVIDRDLLRMEEALVGLATAAEWALQGPEPADAQIYFESDFADPTLRPRDFTDTSKYRWPVSIDEPVATVAPGVDRIPLLPRIRKLSPLRAHIPRMVVDVVADSSKLDAPSARALLLERRSPIDYAYVDLAEGVHYVWPGIAALPPNYDVRTASFYKDSDHRHGNTWGVPYWDSTTDEAGDDLVLPCTRGLWAQTGEFLGVAGVEITVAKMVDTNMVLPSRATMRISLVNAAGQVVVDSRKARARRVTAGRDEANAFVDFDLPDVRAAIRRGEEGLVETQGNGRTIVASFVRLAAIGWYYVVEVDASSLGR